MKSVADLLTCLGWGSTALSVPFLMFQIKTTQAHETVGVLM